MPQTFRIIAENAERRIVTVKEIAGLKISKSIYQPGYWFEMEFDVATPINDLRSKHFITSGKITDCAGVLPDRVTGWCTWKDAGMAPAGVIRRESRDGCELWCVWNGAVPGGDVNHVEVVYLPAGEQYTVPDNSSMFSASGVLLLNGQALADETPYVLKNGERVVSAQKDAYFMHWPIIELTG